MYYRHHRPRIFLAGPAVSAIDFTDTYTLLENLTDDANAYVTLYDDIFDHYPLLH